MVPDSLEGLSQARRADRLEQVIQSAGFESVNGMVVESSNEYNCWSVAGFQRVKDVEAIHVRHLDVEQHQIGLMFFHGAHDRSAVAAFACDFNVLLFLEQPS